MSAGSAQVGDALTGGGTSVSPASSTFLMQSFHTHGAITYTQFDGRRHLVAPVVALIPGVLNGKLATAAEIAKFVESWNGIPIPVDHPTRQNAFVSANSQPVLESCIGRFFDVTFVNNKLTGNLYIDIAKAKRLGGDAALVVARLERGEPVEVSTGYFADILPTAGVCDGKVYDGVQTNLRPDHLAVLPHTRGACNWSDGCGAPRVNAADLDGVPLTAPSRWHRFKESLRSMLSALDDVAPETETPPPTRETEPESAPESAPTPDPVPQTLTAKGDPAMEKAEKLTLLVTNHWLTDAQRSVFEQLPDDALDALVANCTQQAATPKPPPPQPSPGPPQTLPFDEDVQAGLRILRDMGKQINANAATARATLIARGMSVEDANMLSAHGAQLLAQSLVPQTAAPLVNYAGLGFPRTASLGNGVSADDMLGLAPPELPKMTQKA
jgi:hypothetical protein